MALKERWENRTYRPIHRIWPKVSRKATWWLMPVELVLLVPLLVIFGIAQPDLYRTDMWRIGWDNRLNSNPNMAIFAMVNHQPKPDIPFVWSSALTNFNVAISVITLFFLITKLTAFIMKLWFPLIALIANIALATLYAVSVYGQVGPDYADERYPAPAAWYFRYGCDLAKPYGSYDSCQIAQASLGVTCGMLVVYLLNLGFAVYAMWPNTANDRDEDEDDEYDGSSTGSRAKGAPMWEMQGMKTPMTASMPYTPRTQAFHTLDRQLPLRQQQAPRFG
jgi:hypothetical protein